MQLCCRELSGDYRLCVQIVKRIVNGCTKEEARESGEGRECQTNPDRPFPIQAGVQNSEFKQYQAATDESDHVLLQGNSCSPVCHMQVNTSSIMIFQ